MRIALVAETWAPSVDGLVTRLEGTVRALRAGGHEVLVVAPTAGTTIPGVAESRTRTVRLKFLYGGQRWGLPDPALRRTLREFAPDVVHVVNPIFMGAAAVRQVAGHYPLVVSYHTDVTAYAAHYHLGWLRPVIDRLMIGSYRRAQARLATSEVGRQQLADRDITEVAIWPWGVDTGLFRPDRDGARLRARLTPEPDLPLALHVGRVAREKDCQRLLPLASGCPPVHLTFVGDGPDRQRLEGLFEGTRATFVGTLRGEELADAYAAADALIFASQTDTLGLVLLEAMATGLPVVAADTPTARSTLEAYPAAVLVPLDAPAEAWNEAVHAVAGRRQRADDAALAGDWAEATERLVEVYTAAQRQAVDG